jgi:acetyltransferase-like isoleucine patch superfamily enzyme
VMGAGSVVIRTIDAYTIAVSSPVRVVKSRRVELKYSAPATQGR